MRYGIMLLFCLLTLVSGCEEPSLDSTPYIQTYINPWNTEWGFLDNINDTGELQLIALNQMTNISQENPLKHYLFEFNFSINETTKSELGYILAVNASTIQFDNFVNMKLIGVNDNFLLNYKGNSNEVRGKDGGLLVSEIDIRCTSTQEYLFYINPSTLSWLNDTVTLQIMGIGNIMRYDSVTITSYPFYVYLSTIDNNFKKGICRDWSSTPPLGKTHTISFDIDTGY